MPSRHSCIAQVLPLATVPLGSACSAALLALGFLAVVSLPSDASSQTSESWFQLASEVPDTGFPTAFIDSLRDSLNVTNTAALRTAPSAALTVPETFVLEASWGPIKAGYGVLETRPDSAAGVCFLEITAVTNKVIGALYLVQDFIRATVDMQGLYPTFFEEHVREGRYERDRWFLFDHAQGAVYSSMNRAPKVETEPFSLDFLSVLADIRSRELKPGDTFTVRTYVHGKIYPVKIKVHKRDETRTKAGEFRCVIVEPQLVGSGRISRRDRLRLWITDDEYHLLVRAKSRINVGSVNAELIYYERDGRVVYREDD